MSGTRILWGQIAIVLTVVLTTTWTATQWTAWRLGFQPQLGAERPTESVMIDGLNPQSVTLMRFSDYVARTIPDTWLQRDYLPRFQPE